MQLKYEFWRKYISILILNLAIIVQAELGLRLESIVYQMSENINIIIAIVRT